LATLAHDAKLQVRIDGFLRYLIGQWEGIPDLAAEWGDWDGESQADFALDWPVCEDSLTQVCCYAEHGLLTAEQSARYEELLQLVARHRPILDRLLSEDEVIERVSEKLAQDCCLSVRRRSNNSLELVSQHAATRATCRLTGSGEDPPTAL